MMIHANAVVASAIIEMFLHRCERRGASRGVVTRCAGSKWRGRGTQSSVPSHAGDAVRSLGLLAGGVGTDRRSGVHLAGVDRDVSAGINREEKAVHATRCRAGLLLADLVVLRAVAGTFEPTTRVALRNAAAEMGHFWYSATR